jgi:hypothetical protein
MNQFSHFYIGFAEQTLEDREFAVEKNRRDDFSTRLCRKSDRDVSDPFRVEAMQAILPRVALVSLAYPGL